MTRSPSAFVWTLILAQIVVWTIIPYLLATSLPLDVVSDGLSWGHEWQLGYYKHPPLPSWMAEVAFATLGDIGPFLLSQLAVGATYFFVYLLGCQLFPARWAAVGTFLLAGVYYFSIPTPEFNHNVAQMPVWAATAYFYLKAIRYGNLGSWLGLGVGAGLGILTKYESAILFAAIAVHFATTPSARATLSTPGPYVALATALAIASPNLAWLAQHDFSPLVYAQTRAGHVTGWARIGVPLRFLLAQIFDLSPAVLVAAIAGLVGRVSLPVRSIWHDETGCFLLIVGLGPALFAVLLSVFTGFGLLSMWGAPMWNLSGLLLLYLTETHWRKVSFDRLYICTVALFVVLPTCYALATVVGPRLLHRPARTGWPDRALAAALDQAWLADTGRPLRIVAGDGWLAGLIALRSHPRPSVFTDGDFREAPWITPTRLTCEGALVVWQIDAKHGLPANLAALPGFTAERRMSFAWPRMPGVPDLQVGWAVVPPTVCDPALSMRRKPVPRHG